MTQKFKQMELFDPNGMDVNHVLNALDSEMRDAPRVWPALLAELVDTLTDHYETREEMTPQKAMEAAQNVIVVIAHYLGGRNVYLRFGRVEAGIIEPADHQGLARDVLTMHHVGYVVPERLTLYEAASAPESLFIILVGTVFVLPTIIGYTALSYGVFRGKASELRYD